ncbi:MAG: hypothetical protein IKM93_04825 [Bacteroidales bacterium]|nr:hypothetical protein [Bacteroidales bacterium]
MTILEAIAARHSVRKYSDQARALFSLAGYIHIDLGIVKYHFETAAGTANFHWFK